MSEQHICTTCNAQCLRPLADSFTCTRCEKRVTSEEYQYPVCDCIEAARAEGRKQGVAEERARGDKLADGVMDQVERAYHCRSTIGGGIVYERAVETIEELVIAYRGEHEKAGE